MGRSVEAFGAAGVFVNMSDWKIRLSTNYWSYVAHIFTQPPYMA